MTVIPQESAPPSPPGGLEWIRKNLFSTWYNSLLTIAGGTLVYFTLINIVTWIFKMADWRPITVAPLLYLIGQYPREESWRCWHQHADDLLPGGYELGSMEALRQILCYFPGYPVYCSGCISIGNTHDHPADTYLRTHQSIPDLLWLPGWKDQARSGASRGNAVVGLVLLVISLVILPGFNNSSLLPKVPTTVWGGLMITLLLSVGGIVISFPFGILLALGRRSSLPMVKLFSIFFIETVVPYSL